MKKTIIALVAVSLMFGGISPALADGMVIVKPDPYSDRWDFSDETDQQAFISYRNGLEKMIVGIKTDPGAENAVWLFPVPADPARVVMDIVNELPRMNGEEVGAKAKMNLDDAKDFLFSSQIYPLFTMVTMGGSRSYHTDSLSMNSPLAKTAGTVPQDVVVYEHLDKDGMTSEIITAKTADGLFDYFQSKGLKIEKGMISALDSYIGQDYTFVASWIQGAGAASLFGETAEPAVTKSNRVDDWVSQPETPILPPSAYPRYGYNPAPKKNGVKAVSVIFPADEIYFPLLPTSVYESKIVPATIKVVGHVSPKIYQNIENFTKVSYYTDADFYAGPSQVDFFDSVKTKNYTKIEINAPSKYLTEDLRVANRAPLKIAHAVFAANHPLAVSVILLALCSILASLVAGFFLLKGVPARGLLITGLANCFTLVGLAVATMFVHAGTANKNADAILAKLKERGYVWKRRTAAVLLVLSVFWLAASIIPHALSRFPGYYASYAYGSIVPFILLIIALELKRIKESDEAAFAELKKAGYSTWTFRMKEGNKGLFIALFSVIFLLISWIVTSVLKHTV